MTLRVEKERYVRCYLDGKRIRGYTVEELPKCKWFEIDGEIEITEGEVIVKKVKEIRIRCD